MKFFERPSLYDIYTSLCKKGGKVPMPIDTQFRENIKYASKIQNTDLYWEVVTNHAWHGNGKPYYSVWPVILPMLLNVKLNVPASMVKLPDCKPILFRFPEPDGLEVEGFKLRSILAGHVFWNRKDYDGDPNNATDLGLSIYMDFGETEKLNGLEGPIFDHAMIPLFHDETLEEVVVKSNKRSEERKAGKLPPPPRHAFTYSDEANTTLDIPLRIILGVCLLAGDSDLISPDVLSKDREKIERPDLTPEEIQAIIDRAHRRGKIGWDVGKNVEVNPHYRRPHFAIRWTGEGRTTPKLRPVKGCLVKRNKLKQMPTGYLGKDNDQPA